MYYNGFYGQEDTDTIIDTSSQYAVDPSADVQYVDQKIPTATDNVTSILEQTGKEIDKEKSELINKAKTYTTWLWIFGGLSIVFLSIIIYQLSNKKRKGRR